MSRSTGMRLARLTAVKRPKINGAVRPTRTQIRRRQGNAHGLGDLAVATAERADERELAETPLDRLGAPVEQGVVGAQVGRHRALDEFAADVIESLAQQC